MHAHVRGIIYIFNYGVYLYQKSFKSTVSKQNETMKKENEKKKLFLY